MITLELFLSPHCISAPSAIAVAMEAVKQVSGVRLAIRSDLEDRVRARSLGIFVYPAFVLEGEVFSVGEPEVGQLIQFTKQKREEVKQKKKHDKTAKISGRSQDRI